MEAREPNLKTPKVVSIIVARNEENYIEETIRSLLNQTIKPDPIFVVDDGSQDMTGHIAERFGCQVVRLPCHSENYVGRPELAMRWNTGLKDAEPHSPDYILLMGADHPLPRDYVEKVLERMKGKMVVASGNIKGHPHADDAPYGSGRLVDSNFWKKASRMRYPIQYGWESWLLVKAMELGYETRAFKDIVSEASRPIQMSPTKAFNLGIAMYSNGWHWLYVFARTFIRFKESPRAGASMLAGYLKASFSPTHSGVRRSDVAEWFNAIQKRRFWGRALRFIRRGGRR